MCTAATYKTKDFYFGRTLDYEVSYGDEIIITPRNYPIDFRFMGKMKSHHAIIGMACCMNGFPLYFDAINECGLGMAGLNFVGNAKYNDVEDGKQNVAQYEIILWVLSQCKSVDEARALLSNINITNTAFSDNLPPAQLHWIIVDENEAITLEATKNGVEIFDNPVGVLTNNPPFEQQMFNLNNYRGLSTRDSESTFANGLDLNMYSRGMGAIGLPGDLSSQSRFVRVAFVKMNSVSNDDELSSVSQFFHILGSVDQQRGLDYVHGDKLEITIYTSCCNASKGIYYYTTYDNHQISAVDMHKEDLNACDLIRFETIKGEQIRFQN